VADRSNQPKLDAARRKLSVANWQLSDGADLVVLMLVRADSIVISDLTDHNILKNRGTNSPKNRTLFLHLSISM
jgi:hypothetical protein